MRAASVLTSGREFHALRAWVAGGTALMLIPLSLVQWYTGRHGPWVVDPVVLTDWILIVLCLGEVWSILMRGRGSWTAPLLPLLAAIATILNLWLNGPAHLPFVMLSAVVLFIFLSMRAATYGTLGMLCASAALLRGPWQADGVTLLLIPAAGGSILALLMMARLSLDRLTRSYRSTSTLLEETLASAEYGIAVIGADGVVKRWNPKVAELLDVPPQYLDGRPVHVREMIALAESRGERPLIAASSPEAAHAQALGDRLWDPSYPPRFVRRSLQGRWIEVVTRQMPSGDIVRSYADITPYQQAVQEAEQASRTRAVLLGSVSHELNTPLNAILGLSHLALDSELSVRQRQWIEQIQGSGLRLARLVSDALDLSSLESGATALQRRPYQLQEILAPVEQAIGPRCAAKGMEFEVVVAPDVPAELTGDVERLGRILIGLADEAEQVAERGRLELRVTTSRDASGSPCACFAIRHLGLATATMRGQAGFSSTGDGMTEATARGDEGLGLSRRYVTLMGGTLAAEHVDRDGWAVRFAIPTMPPELPQASAVRPVDVGADGVRVSEAVQASPRAAAPSEGTARAQAESAGTPGATDARRRVNQLIETLSVRRGALAVLPYRAWVFANATAGIGLLAMAILTVRSDLNFGVNIRNRVGIPAFIISGIFLASAWRHRRLDRPWQREVVMLMGCVIGTGIAAILLNGAQASIFLGALALYGYLVLPQRGARVMAALLLVGSLLAFLAHPGEFLIYSRALTAGAVTIVMSEWLMRSLRLATETFDISATELREASSHLLAENAELSRSRRAAEEAMERRTELMSAVSHEIRTPMNAIRGLTQLALQSELTARQREWMERIQRNGVMLMELVSNILDMTRMEAGKAVLVSAPFDLLAVTRHAGDVLAVEAEAKRLRHDFDVGADVPRWVRGDLVRLTQILLNLISNAVKFTERGRVGVRVRRTSGEAGGVGLRIEVQDTGQGIAPENIERLFRRFEQLGDVESRRSGSGLGLAITKWLVEQMGGEIGVRSEPGVGSTFWCTVQLAEASAEDGVAASGAEAAPRRSHRLTRLAGRSGARVLVVDDNAINREIAVELLRNTGIEAEQAEDGASAIARIESGSYQLVLLDLQMPGLNGIEVTQRVRRRKTATELPIIAMTASSLEEDVARCLAAGMNDYLAKPFEPSDLWQVVRRWVPGDEEGSSMGSLPELTPIDPVRVDVPAIRGLVVAEGLQRVMGNVVLYRSLLLEFERGQADVVHRIRTALLADDLTTAERLAHSLTGVAGGIGANEVQAAAALVEREVRRGRGWAEMGAMVEELRLKLEPLLADLQTFVALAPSGTPVARAVEDVPVRLEEFAGLLAASNPEAREWMHHYGAVLDHLGAAPASAIRDAVMRFDLPAAEALLRAARRA